MVLNLIFKQIQIFQFGNWLRPHYELTQESRPAFLADPLLCNLPRKSLPILAFDQNTDVQFFQPASDKKKRVAGFLQLPVYTGGADETRTRDLRRDRPGHESKRHLLAGSWQFAVNLWEAKQTIKAPQKAPCPALTVFNLWV